MRILTEEQFQREANFRFALSMMKTLYERGLLTRAEFCNIKSKLIRRYDPVWGHLADEIGG